MPDDRKPNPIVGEVVVELMCVCHRLVKVRANRVTHYCREVPY